MVCPTASHPLRTFLLTGSPLLLTLAAVAASAQEASDPPARPDDPARAAADRRERPGRGWPDGTAPWQWPGGRAPRERAALQPAQRLDQLEAKLDTLIDEVRQLRRAINRQRADLQRSSNLPPRGPGDRPRAGSFGSPPRGAWDRGGPQPPAPPYGPRAERPMWRQFPPPGGPPWGGWGWGPPPYRRGGEDRDADRPPRTRQPSPSGRDPRGPRPPRLDRDQDTRSDDTAPPDADD